MLRARRELGDRLRSHRTRAAMIVDSNCPPIQCEAATRASTSVEAVEAVEAVAAGGVPDSLLRELMSMGFEEGAARAALAKANGSQGTAVEILLASS